MAMKWGTWTRPAAVQVEEDKVQTPRAIGKIADSMGRARRGHRPTLLLSVIMAAVTCILAALQTVLDITNVHADPVLQDGFRLALGSLLASIAADRLIAASGVRRDDE